MQRDDSIRLRHMLDAAREAESFVRDKARGDLESDRKLVLALVKSIEIIGEAATKTSQHCRGELPHIPWADIVGMRNRLIHAYFDINLDVLWMTVRKDLPPLIAALEKALPSREKT